jgi:phosphoribosylanthranilate isomerase
VDGLDRLGELARWHVRAFVLDAPSEGFGGSGATFDWSIARAAAAQRPVVLAGGLTPENVQEAIRAVRPWAIDVASGVESSPGIKDRERMARFLARAKEID